jgi:hypothetical protein
MDIYIVSFLLRTVSVLNRRETSKLHTHGSLSLSSLRFWFINNFIARPLTPTT